MAKLYTRDGKYWLDYVDATGKRIRRAGAKDKSVAAKMLADAESAVERIRAGILHADPKEAKKPFLSHVTEYVSEMRRLGRDEMYSYTVRKHLENAAKAQKWDCLMACTGRSVSGYLRKLADQKLSAKTVNAHRADISAFMAWCVRNGLLEANPCDQVTKSTVKGDKTRRALAIAEVRKLIDAAPAQRRVVYQFLVYTGLRRSEAAALRWGHIHMDALNAYVELPASLTKSGRAESVPLVPEVVGALRQHRGTATDADPVFAEIPSMPDFRLDLAAAGIADEDARGRKVVLHSLRHSLATMLAMSQVPMVVAQKIMRHRDIKLTAEVYTDEGLLPLSAAMNSLPSLSARSA